jgi:hypothetical protein
MIFVPARFAADNADGNARESGKPLARTSFSSCEGSSRFGELLFAGKTYHRPLGAADLKSRMYGSMTFNAQRN